MTFPRETQPNRRDVLAAGVATAGTLLTSGLITSNAACGQGRGGGSGRRGGGMRPINYSPDSPALAFTADFCERCGDCHLACSQLAGVDGYPVPQGEEACIYCGQCTMICQGMAVRERFHYEEVAKILLEKDKIPIAIMAPSVRVSIGDLFGGMPGADLEGKLIRGLREIGFKHVFDASFAADLVACEEAAELLARLEKGEVQGPMFTSCCPAWYRFVELYYPELVKDLSSVKSPILALSTLAKTWFAEKENLDPEKIVTVAFAPCTAKKYERTRPEHQRTLSNGHTVPMLDFALTTRETALLLKGGGVSRLLSLENDEFDILPGTASGAGLIFGSTGGVCESAVRAAWSQVNEGDPPAELLHWQSVRSLDAIRTAEVTLGTRTIRVAVVHCTANVRFFLEEMKKRGLKFDFVEVMACPGGCIGGGGQPRPSSGDTERMINRRSSTLYRRDEKSPVRIPARNPAVETLYRDYLTAPGSTKSLDLLHVGQR